jgi:hypothetical protein
MKRRTFFAAALFAFPMAHALAAEGRLFYSRSFPQSVPAYFEITVEPTGDAVYKESPDDELPLKFKLASAELQQVYDLAAKLDYFKQPLESQLKVAFMGDKILRYMNGDSKSEQKYNYSENPSAQSLTDWFERMAESVIRRSDLERAAKYDHLGVDKALNQIYASMEEGHLVALEQFLPMLDRIAKNETYMHQSRAKAAEVAEFIRNSKK